MMKKLVSYKIDAELIEMFGITVSTKKDGNLSEVVEMLIRDYVVRNKVDVEEAMMSFWGVKNNGLVG